VRFFSGIFQVGRDPPVLVEYTDPPKTSYGSPQANYGTPQTSYGPPKSSYGPSDGSFEPSGGAFVPSSGSFVPLTLSTKSPRSMATSTAATSSANRPPKEPYTRPRYTALAN
jgi:hypothetical protein